MTLVRSILLALAVLVPATWTVALAEDAPAAKKDEKKKDDKKKDDKKDKAEKK